MATKRSEDYVYFQNKAHHYHNLEQARSRIRNRQLGALSYTIEHPHNRDLTYLRQHEIEEENRKNNSRINAISTTPNHQIIKEGEYCRYNKFERPFRKSIPERTETERKIQLENEKYLKHLVNIKPTVGSVSEWQKNSKNKELYRRISSKYNNDDDRKAKQTLKVDNEPFLLDPYRKFLDHVSRSGSHHKLKESATSRPRYVKVEKERLFILPAFSRNETVLGSSRASETEPQEQAGGEEKQ